MRFFPAHDRRFSKSMLGIEKVNRFMARLAASGRRVVNEDSRPVSDTIKVVLVHYLQFLVRLFQLFILLRSGLFPAFLNFFMFINALVSNF